MFNYYMNVIIKPRTKLDIPNIAVSIELAFKNYEKVIFIFDLTETSIFNFQSLMRILPLLKRFDKEIETKLEKSYIILKEAWKKNLLLLFFSYYEPKKPVEFTKEIPQNQGFNSSVLL